MTRGQERYSPASAPTPPQRQAWHVDVEASTCSPMLSERDTVLLILRLLLPALCAILATSLLFAFVATTDSPGNLLYALLVHGRTAVQTECAVWVARVDCSSGRPPLLEHLQVPQGPFFLLPLMVFIIAVFHLLQLALVFRAAWGRWRGAAIVGVHLAVPGACAIALLWPAIIDIRVWHFVVPLGLLLVACGLWLNEAQEHQLFGRTRLLLLVLIMAVPTAAGLLCNQLLINAQIYRATWPWFVVIPLTLTVMRAAIFLFDQCTRFALGPLFEVRLLATLLLFVVPLTGLRKYIGAQLGVGDIALSTAIVGGLEVLQGLAMLLGYRWLIKRAVRRGSPRDRAFLESAVLLQVVGGVVTENVAIFSSAAQQLVLDPQLYAVGSPTAPRSLADVGRALAIQVSCEWIVDLLNLGLYFCFMRGVIEGRARSPLRLRRLVVPAFMLLAAICVCNVGPEIRRGCLSCGHREQRKFSCPVACAE